MDPLVTVAITSYNYGAFVGDAVKSALAQTYRNVEVLVLDNASTDDSLEVIRSFDDPRIRLIARPENIGIQRNHIDAIAQARGEYVVFLSADDMLLPTLVQDAVEFRARHPEIDVVYASAIITDAECNMLEYFEQPSLDGAESYRSRNEFASLLVRDSSMYLPTILFPKSVFEELGVWDHSLEVAVDYEYTIRMASAGKRFAFIARPGALIRQHGENRSGVKHFVATGKQLREFCTLLERYTQPQYHQRLAGWNAELSAMVDKKVAEMRGPFPSEYASMQQELQAYERRARESMATVPAIGSAILNAEGLISVVVPFHGRIGPLQRALQSLARQTYRNWEAIVVADSTFDPSDAIAWMGLSDRVRVARSRTTHGPAASRNLGIGGVNGEIVAYLDEDNRYDPGYLDAVAKALANPAANATVARARFAVVAPNGTVVLQRERGLPTAPGGGVSYAYNAVPLNCVAHRRSCIAQIGGPFNITLNALEDWEFLLRLNRHYPLQPLEATVQIDTDLWLRGHHLFGRRTGPAWSEYASLLQAIYGAYPARDAVEAQARTAFAASLQETVQRGVNAAGNAAGVADFVLALGGANR